MAKRVPTKKRRGKSSPTIQNRTGQSVLPVEPSKEERLIGTRNGILELLEIYWAEIGLDIARIRTREDVRRVFTSHDFFGDRGSYELFQIVGQDSSRKLSLLRKEVKETQEKLSDRYAELREVDELRGRVQSVLRDAREDERLELDIGLEQLTREYEQIKAERDRLSAVRDALKRELRLSEAAFSQDQVVQFVSQKRYAVFNPVNVAGALAGLPFIGYRESISKCRKLSPRRCSHLRYEEFRAIEFLCKKLGLKKLRLELREHVLALPSRFSSAKAEFKRNFYFLRRAVERASETKSVQAQAPFCIVSNYHELMSSIPVLDLLRARAQKLR